MPEMKDGESYNDWMNRCIPVVHDEDKGKKYDKDHAVAKCNGMWETAKKHKHARKMLNE